MDFTIKKYRHLLHALKDAGYGFQPFAGFIERPEEKVIVLRHDVDARKLNSLLFARLQAKEGIRGTYYFRIVPKSFDENVIREIAALGHEIGYHYETMDTCRGDIDKAYNEFCRNLDMFRKIVPVKTICMHGSPLSKYDNRSLWKKYDYKTLGITGEPYFDIDFGKVLYLTDTGRRWDGQKVSVRDKVQGDDYRNQKSTQHLLLPSLHSTNDIIAAASAGKLPDQIMFTFHPQRWTDKPLPWVSELLWQNMKNFIKRMIIK
ncbi:MAG: hypothetical protein RQ761_02845 [Bacteroidales bacterium]|nr:hypothetical protein [Bacteroidales bacterium]